MIRPRRSDQVTSFSQDCAVMNIAVVQKPPATRSSVQLNVPTQVGINSAVIVPIAANAVNARMCPTRRTNRPE